MRPIYIDVPVKINADTAADLQRLHSRVGWKVELHRACREALQDGEQIIDNRTVTELVEIIEAKNRARPAPRSYGPADVASRFD